MTFNFGGTWKPLEDGDSLYDVRSCPKKDHNHQAYFLSGQKYMPNFKSKGGHLLIFSKKIIFLKTFFTFSFIKRTKLLIRIKFKKEFMLSYAA